HLPTSASLSGPGTPGPGIRPVIRRPSGERSRNSGLRFPAAFRPPAFASWAPCPARGFRPHYSRPTATGAHTRTPAADPGRVYTFHTRETQTGPGALFTARMAVVTGRR